MNHGHAVLTANESAWNSKGGLMVNVGKLTLYMVIMMRTAVDPG